MRVIGLTGGIATGKSTASILLKEIGHTIIDADIIAREVVEPGNIAHGQIVEAFGREVLNQDGTIDRKKLGGVVFSRYEKLTELNEIVHPQVRIKVKALIMKYREEGKSVVFFDCPLIFESRMESFVDDIWLIYADESTQLKRLQARDHISEHDALMRIKAQMPIEEKRRLATVVIDNTQTMSELRMQLVELLKGIS